MGGSDKTRGLHLTSLAPWQFRRFCFMMTELPWREVTSLKLCTTYLWLCDRLADLVPDAVLHMDASLGEGHSGICRAQGYRADVSTKGGANKIRLVVVGSRL